MGLAGPQGKAQAPAQHPKTPKPHEMILFQNDKLNSTAFNKISRLFEIWNLFFMIKSALVHSLLRHTRLLHSIPISLANY